MAEKFKSLKLRAFHIKNISPSLATSDCLLKLKDRLSKIEDAEGRRMQLDTSDPDQESDILCSYNVGEDFVFGIVGRVLFKDSEDRLDISVLKQSQFLPYAAHDMGKEKGLIFRRTTHFLLSRKYLITDLPYPKTIKDTENYLNYLMDSVHFFFSPIISEAPEIRLGDLKEIEFYESNPDLTVGSDKKGQGLIKQTRDLSATLLKYVLAENNDLISRDIADIMSGKVVLEFKKPRSMSEEEYKKLLSIALKPMSDLGNVTLVTRKNKKIKAKDILLDKKIDVEISENGYVSEIGISQAMREFLNEIE